MQRCSQVSQRIGRSIRFLSRSNELWMIQPSTTKEFFAPFNGRFRAAFTCKTTELKRLRGRQVALLIVCGLIAGNEKQRADYKKYWDEHIDRKLGFKLDQLKKTVTLAGQREILPEQLAETKAELQANGEL
ncbi:MAG: hypothetical protein MHM6MM_000924 [Cercozoa sp. M6MM]